MGVGAADKRDPESAGQMDIIDILALAQEHSRVFDPSHPRSDCFSRTDQTRGHWFSPDCVRSRTIARLYLEVKVKAVAPALGGTLFPC